MKSITSHQTNEEKAEKELLVASQWQLIRWKFFRHKVARASLGVLCLLYLSVIFAGFLGPYNPWHYDKNYVYCPPQKLRFKDGAGRFHLRPFVYGVERHFDEKSLLVTYSVDKTRKYLVRFFVRGDTYKFWGMFNCNIHFFGVVEEGATIFLFGTDIMGRDLLSRILQGGRISLSIGLMGVATSFLLGILIGGISGYFGGTVDLLIQRIIEFIKSVPTLPLWMALSIALPPQWPIVKVYFAIVFILSLVGWTGLARVVRGKFMSLREEDFVMIAKLQGASELRIVFKYLLPSFVSHIIAALTLSIPGMILGETALSFIGLGMQPPALSWGVLLKEAQSIMVLAHHPWLFIPGVLVCITVLSFNFVGDGLRDAADPYATI